MRFQDKVVLITGGSSGIGAATALLVAREGGKVVIVGRNVEKLKKVEETSEKAGNKLFVLNADITKESDAKKIVETTVNKYGRLDVLVNNAGIIRFASLLDGKLMDIYDEVMNVNLRAAVFLSSLATPHLIKTKGNIVNVSSVQGKKMSKKDAHSYNASKAALDHFSRSVALELGAQGVRVNIVSPGPVRTDILEHVGSLGDSIWKRAKENTLLKRISDAEETAKVIAFLISDDAIGITGSDYVADNGYLLC